MDIILFHGYELTGSGSNEYNRYLARAFLRLGNRVHIICREQNPYPIEFIGEFWRWDEDAGCTVTTINKDFTDKCLLHYIPSGDIYPVYLTDKQRPGNVRSFAELSDDELNEFISLNELLLDEIFATIDADICFANHIVMQPYLALPACNKYEIPLAIFLHGSAIEYTVKKDIRYKKFAEYSLKHCDAIITGNNEVRDRLTGLFPDIAQQIGEKSRIVGIGVDTSLFSPVAKSERSKKIAAFLESEINISRRAKKPEQLAELHTHLDQHGSTDLQRFFNDYNENSIDADIVAKLCSINLEQPILLFVGALTAGKGLQSLIVAMPAVLQKFPDCRLLIVGSGAYREVLEALVYAISSRNAGLLDALVEQGFDLDRSLESGPWLDVKAYLDTDPGYSRLFEQGQTLQRQCTFLGRMDHHQLSYLFPCADIAVFPSVVPEAYGLVIMEALANGVAPLASWFSGFRDSIDQLNDDLDASLVDLFKIAMDTDQRIPSIIHNIIALLELLHKQDISQQLAEIVRKKYDWTHRAESMLAIFNKILGTPKKQAS